MSTLPTYPWRLAPDGLATFRQLRAMGLRPGGHDPIAQIEQRRRRGREPLVAYLYRIDNALPVRPMTPARWRAIGAANAAQRRCAACQLDRGYRIPRTLGVCVPCHDNPTVSTELAAYGYAA